MPKCCIVMCGAQKTKNQPQLTLHRFPKNEGLRRKWLDAVGEKNINPRHKDWVLCSLHFEESCFNRTLDVTRLRDYSVPSIFPLNSNQNDFSTGVDNVNEDSQQGDKGYVPLSPLVDPLGSPGTMLDPLGGPVHKEPSEEFHQSAPATKCNISNVIAQNNELYRAQQKIKRLQEKVISHKRKIKCLNEKVRRQKKKIATFIEVIKELKDKNPIYLINVGE